LFAWLFVCLVVINTSLGCVVNEKSAQLSPASEPNLDLPRTRPLAVAHRGFSARAPENTLAAYRLAIETGIEMAECDVRLSADGVAVLMHDKNLKRVAGVDASVRDLTLEQLKQLDVGKWKSPEYKGERIPTLKELLALIKGRIRLVIEIKDKDMEKQVVADIRASGIEPQDLMIFSFHHGVVERIAKLEPLLPTTWLINKPLDNPEDRRQLIGRALQSRVSALGSSKEKVNPQFVRLAHECGFQVFVWTVDNPADMRMLIRMGVDGIISNCPVVLLRVLDNL
jgi:glycerophosphoryl diester phosphodiesterase